MIIRPYDLFVLLLLSGFAVVARAEFVVRFRSLRPRVPARAEAFLALSFLVSDLPAFFILLVSAFGSCGWVWTFTRRRPVAGHLAGLVLS
jgi:hypothetical protein